VSQVVQLDDKTFQRILSLSRLLKISVPATIAYLLERVASEEPA
jgi:hypothetical protein